MQILKFLAFYKLAIHQIQPIGRFCYLHTNFDPIFIILPGGVRTSRLFQDVGHDLLYMTVFDLELYSSCTTVQASWRSRVRKLSISSGENQVPAIWPNFTKTVKYHHKPLFLVSLNVRKQFILKKA